MLPISYFGYFGHVCPLPSKTIKPTCRDFDVYLYAKTSSLTCFLRYCKGIANLQFWELWECLTIPKLIVSICTKLTCLFTSKKSTLITHFFLRYCKEIVNLLFWVIWTFLVTHT